MPYTSKGSRCARRVFEQKTVFDIFCHYDLLFSMMKAYHEKGNLILISLKRFILLLSSEILAVSQ